MKSTIECDLFFNTGSGSEADSRFDELKAQLEESGAKIVKAWKIGEELKFPVALHELQQSPTKLVVVAGGDGTISGVTSVLAQTEKTMSVVPSGTFNYFARNLLIPETMPEAVKVLLDGVPRKIPLGKVNDVYFLNNASFGLYPTALKKREQHYKNWGRGRLIAMWSLLSTLLGKHKLYRTVFRTDTKEVSEVTPFVFVGANEFQIEEMGLRGQRCLEKEKLAVYITRVLTIGQRLVVILKAMFRRLEKAQDYKLTCAESLNVEFKRDHIQVAVDGEVRTLKVPLQFALVPKALRVIVPIPESTKEAPNP